MKEMKVIIKEITRDSKGNLLPENFKLEHLIKIGEAVGITYPTKFQKGLIVRFYFRDEVEFLKYIDSESVFNKILEDFEGVETMLNWGVISEELEKSL